MNSCLELMVLLQSHDVSIRSNAEEKLTNILMSSDGILIVGDICRESNIPVHYRQLGFILLSHTISRFLSTFNLDQKRVIIELALSSIANIDIFIQKGARILLSRYARLCDEAEFCFIINQLKSTINCNGGSLLHLKALFDIAREVECNRHIDIIKMFYDLLKGFLSLDNRRNIGLIRYSIKIMKYCMESISQEGYDPEEIFETNIIADWSVLILSWIHNCSNLNEALSSEGSVIIEIFSSLSLVLENFPFEEQFILTCAITAWNFLDKSRPFFRYENLSGMCCDGYSSDGDRCDIESIITQAFEVLCIGVSMDSVDIVSAIGISWELFFDSLTYFGCLSPSMIKEYFESGNEFMTKDQEEKFESNLRNNCSEVVETLCKSDKKRYEHFLLFVNNYFHQNIVNHPFSVDRQRHLESMMWLLEAICSALVRRVNRNELDKNFVASVVQTITCYALYSKREECEIWLVARSFLVVAEFASLYDSSIASRIAVDIVSFLSHNCSKSSLLAGNLQCCRALGILALQSRKTSSSLLSLEQTLCGISSLVVIANECEDSTIHFALEAITYLLQISTDIFEFEVVGKLSTFAMETVLKYSSDSLVISRVESLFYAIFSVMSNDQDVSILENIYLPLVDLLTQSTKHHNSLLLWEFSNGIYRSLVSRELNNNNNSNNNSNSNDQMNNNTSDNRGRNRKTPYIISVLKCLESRQKLSRDVSPALLREVFNSINISFEGFYVEKLPSEIHHSQLFQGIVTQFVALFPTIIETCTIEASGMYQKGLVDCISPAMGLFCHIIVIFDTELSQSNLLLHLFQSILTCMKQTESLHVRNVILMSLMHLSARKSDVLFPILQFLQSQPGFETLFLDLLSYWLSVHTSIETKYCVRISVIGLLQVMKMLSYGSNNAAFLAHIARTVISTIQAKPFVLDFASEIQMKGQDCSMVGANRWNSCHGTDVDDYFNEEEDDEDLDDDCFDYGANSEEIDDKDPFAPAEDYLSDADDNNPVVFTNLVENLLFDPLWIDPLNVMTVSELVASILPLLGQYLVF